MITSASRTLTAAMTPSMMFVVASPSIMASERVGLTERRERPGVPPIAKRLVDGVPALGGHTNRAPQRAAQLRQLVREVLERRLQLTTQFTAALGEQHV